MRCFRRIVRILGTALMLWICLCQVQAAGAQTETEDGEISVVQEELLGQIELEEIQKLVDGILDLTLHELTSEYFGGGFSYGPKAKIRLVESVEKKVPLVISIGGLDFVDFSTSELPDRMGERKYMLHNANTAHIKILPEEAEALGKILAERLSKVTYPVKLLIPTKGMRHNTLEGQELYEPKSDSVLIQTIIENVNDNVEVIVIPHNLDTPEFGVKAAHYIVDEMKKQGKLPQNFGEN